MQLEGSGPRHDIAGRRMAAEGRGVATPRPPQMQLGQHAVLPLPRCIYVVTRSRPYLETRGRGLAGQGRREREGLLSEGSRLDFSDGLSDEGAFLVVIPDGTGVKRAGGVAVFRATEGQEKATIRQWVLNDEADAKDLKSFLRKK